MNTTEKSSDSSLKKMKVDLPPTLEIQFEAQGFGAQLQQTMKQLYRSDLLSDITLVVGEERIKAHKFILFAWSKKLQVHKQTVTLFECLTDPFSFSEH